MKIKIINTILILSVLSAGFAYASSSLTVESNSQEFKDSERKIFLEGDVKIKSNDINVQGPRAIVEVDPKNNKVNNVSFKDKAYSYRLKDGKRHEVKAQILEMSLLNNILKAEGNTILSITENDRPVVIVTADRQEYHKVSNTMKAYGSVNITYKDMTTFSNSAVVDLTENNNVKQIQLIGNAKLNQDKSKISAEKLIYNNIKEEATAVGRVYSDITTEDNKNIKVWSNYQSYNKKNNLVSASGSARIKYEDYLATGPKVNVYGDKKTKKLNEAVFIGRSKIETKGRSIEADRITITLNPKDFKAEGNVKSIIPNIGE